MTNRRGMTHRAYAKHRDCDTRTVRHAKRKGWLVHYSDGSIDPTASDKLWDSQRNPLHHQATKGPAYPLAALVAKANPTAPAATPTLTNERAEHEKAKRRKTEIIIAQLEGHLVDRTHAERVIYAVLRTARDKALNIPARVADELAAAGDARAIQAILTREIRDALDVPDVEFTELLARHESE